MNYSEFLELEDQLCLLAYEYLDENVLIYLTDALEDALCKCEEEIKRRGIQDERIN